MSLWPRNHNASNSHLVAAFCVASFQHKAAFRALSSSRLPVNFGQKIERIKNGLRGKHATGLGNFAFRHLG
jgi:hypothetical protein